MNQVFSFKRYWWLLKRQWCENEAIYKWGIVFLVLVTGFQFWLFSDWKAVSKPELGQFKTFFKIVAIPMYIYGALFFWNLSIKHKKMFYFSLPVSSLERFAVAFTYVMVLMPVFLLTVFTLFDFLSVQIFNHIHETSTQMFFKMPLPVPIGHKGLLFISLSSFLSNTSIFTLGSLLFGKKGPLISIILFMFTVGICVLIEQLFFKENSPTLLHFMIINNIYLFIILIFWTTMYFVIKKKEA